MNYPSATYTGLTVAEDPSECTSDGDSGGSVYRDQGDFEALAVGIISGSNNGGFGLSNCRTYYSPLNGLWFDAGQVDLH